MTVRRNISALCVLCVCLAGFAQEPSSPPSGFARVPGFHEIENAWTDTTAEVRISLNFPRNVDDGRNREVMLILYALPNGNTIEQTMGRKVVDGVDWHFGIQHIAAQTRYLRRLLIGQNVAIAYLEARGLSWPRWRRAHQDGGAIIRRIVDTLRAVAGGANVRVALSGHSGGGSFLFGYINACDSLPPYIERVSFLDSNYGFNDDEGHTAKLLAWLRGNGARVLSVVAYDDRNIVLDGKLVVGPEGGTYRRTIEMARCFGRESDIHETRKDSLLVFDGMGGQVEFVIHENPENAILHTRLIGDMNAFLHAMTLHRDLVIPLGGPVVYGEFVAE
jgi:hypothetical protein